jgi:hypothetical protein
MRKLIRTDGSTMELPAGLTMEELSALIGAELCDVVSLRHLGEPLHVMLVDDAGYETSLHQRGPGHFELVTGRARKPINAEATALYRANCEPGATDEIVGDVVVVPDSDFIDPGIGHAL